MIKDIFYNLNLHCSKWENYFEVYETYFHKFINESPVVVEVGICQGGSAEMWLKYFGPESTIVGIDIQDCTNYTTKGCTQIIGDQGNPAFWDSFLQKYPKIDIFIDDGSHQLEHQILTLQKVWPFIKNNGVYICEDTHTNLWSEFKGGIKNKNTFLEYSKDLTDILLNQHSRGIGDSNYLNLVEHYKNLYSVSFYDSMVVFQKKESSIINNVWSKPPQ